MPITYCMALVILRLYLPRPKHEQNLKDLQLSCMNMDVSAMIQYHSNVPYLASDMTASRYAAKYSPEIFNFLRYVNVKCASRCIMYWLMHCLFNWLYTLCQKPYEKLLMLINYYYFSAEYLAKLGVSNLAL